jgi:hypothetical protein
VKSAAVSDFSSLIFTTIKDKRSGIFLTNHPIIAADGELGVGGCE